VYFPVTEGEREAKQREINSPIKESCLTKEAGRDERTAIQNEGRIFWALILKENEDMMLLCNISRASLNSFYCVYDINM
jgi:hypothetical protein